MISVHSLTRTTHVGRQRKGSVALIMGLFPASFALAWVSHSFGLSGKTVLHFPCAAGVGSVVEVGTACRHGYADLKDHFAIAEVETSKILNTKIHSYKDLPVWKKDNAEKMQCNLGTWVYFIEEVQFPYALQPCIGDCLYVTQKQSHLYSFVMSNFLRIYLSAIFPRIIHIDCNYFIHLFYA